MGQPTVTILDPVHCKANPEARALILPCLEYQDKMYRRGRFGGKTTERTAHLITGRKGTGGTFLAGLLPKVIEYARKNDIKLKIDGKENIEFIKPSKKPKLKGIKFRLDQRKVLRIVKKKQRGNIIATTGSGKTVIANGIFSMFPKNTILFLCHTKDLISQTYDSISDFIPKRKVFIIGGGHNTKWKSIIKTKSKGPIVIATIQSFAKLDPLLYADFFDITIVDEVHHVNAKKSLYGKVMELNLSPRRYGLTATRPTNNKEMLICEGFFGPVISELTMNDGIKKGINAIPKIDLIPVPYNGKIADKCGKTYKKYYQYGIVENEVRNKLLFKAAKKSIDKNKIVLIIIEKTEHGRIIQKLFKANGLRVPFVYGKTPKEDREKVKNRLKSGKINCAICSRIWREGTNIPALNHIINAHGMKEEKIIIQAMGRGLRTTTKKKTIKLTDFLDPYLHLAQHCIKRIQIYVEQGWI